MQAIKLFFAALLISLAGPAGAQQAILQSGAVTAGHMPMYVNSGSSQPVVTDSGTAGGGVSGVNPKELGLTVRGTGTPPYANAGTGPYGANFCDYDAPVTNTTGYHYFCLSPNAQGGGLMAYGAGGTASQLPLTMLINGVNYTFPFVTGGIVGPATTVIGDVPAWANTVGTLLSDSGKVLPSGAIVGTTDSQVLTNKSIAASEVNSGTLAAAQMPGLTGDVTSSAGTVATTIANSAISTAKIASSAVTNAKLANAANNTIKSNVSGISAAPADNTISAVLDSTLGSTKGDVIYRGASTWAALPTGGTAHIITRTAAAALDLSAFTTLITDGYSTAGDGGGATFYNIGTAVPLDSRVTTFAVTRAGTGCTNGTQEHLKFTGGTGEGFWGYGAITAGALSPFTVEGPGGGYAVGDVLTASTTQVTGCSSSPQVTVTGISTALASFTGAGGNNWQYVPKGPILAAAFGVKGDGLSGSPTDNLAALQAADYMAMIDTSPPLDWGPGTTQGEFGQTVLLPKGSMLFCGSNGAVPLQIDAGVTFTGLGNNASVLLPCTTWAAANHMIVLGKTGTTFSCLDAAVSNLQVNAHTINNAGTDASVFYSDCMQDANGGITYVTIYAGSRHCIWLNGANGGAAAVQLEHIDCTNGQSASFPHRNSAIQINWAGTPVNLSDVVVNGGSPTDPGSVGIRAADCNCQMFRVHSESNLTGVSIGAPSVISGNAFISINGYFGGSGTYAVSIDNTVPSNIVLLQDIQKGGATNALNNRGSTVTASILTPTVF